MKEKGKAKKNPWLLNVLVSACVALVVSLSTSLINNWIEGRIILDVRLKPREQLPRTSPCNNETPHVKVVSIVQVKSEDTTPFIIITNNGKKPVSITEIFLLGKDSTRTLWGSGWFDGFTNEPISFPFYLRPDTFLCLTSNYPIDTQMIYFDYIYIQPSNRKKPKRYSLDY